MNVQLKISLQQLQVGTMRCWCGSSDSFDIPEFYLFQNLLWML